MTSSPEPSPRWVEMARCVASPPSAGRHSPTHSGASGACRKRFTPTNPEAAATAAATARYRKTFLPTMSVPLLAGRILEGGGTCPLHLPRSILRTFHNKSQQAGQDRQGARDHPPWVVGGFSAPSRSAQ